MVSEKTQFLFYSFRFPFFLKLLLLLYQLIDALTLFPVISPNILIIFSGKLVWESSVCSQKQLASLMAFLTLIQPCEGFSLFLTR